MGRKSKGRKRKIQSGKEGRKGRDGKERKGGGERVVSWLLEDERPWLQTQLIRLKSKNFLLSL